MEEFKRWLRENSRLQLWILVFRGLLKREEVRSMGKRLRKAKEYVERAQKQIEAEAKRGKKHLKKRLMG